METRKPRITHLFRPFNLVTIAATMILLKIGLLEPMLRMISEVAKMELVSQISIMQFALLMASVILIAAGGYILNDIKDVKADEINGNGNPVGTLISPEKANMLYQVTTILGLGIGFFIAFQLGNYNFGIIQLTAAISLWFYNNYFKTSFLSGNLMVAFVVALVPLTVGIYEVSLVQIAYFNKVTEFKDFNFNFLAYWFIAYSVFVFLITLIREIIKDLEDMEGDTQIGATTLAITLGEKMTKVISSLLIVLAILALGYARMYYLIDGISSTFILLTIILLVINMVVLWVDKKILFKASTWTKVVSIIGVLYLYALGYVIDNQLFFNV